uniref:Uncharacterized protein n=1 Tax=Calidris pygmaea TaxID=425635 RepID=A0A8C3KHL0_9CHAR
PSAAPAAARGTLGGILGGSKGHQAPHSTSGDIQGHQPLPGNPEGSKGHQAPRGTSGGSKGLHGTPGGSKGHQAPCGTSGGSKGLHGTPGGSKGHQAPCGISGGSKGHVASQGALRDTMALLGRDSSCRESSSTLATAVSSSTCFRSMCCMARAAGGTDMAGGVTLRPKGVSTPPCRPPLTLESEVQQVLGVAQPLACHPATWGGGGNG